MTLDEEKSREIGDDELGGRPASGSRRDVHKTKAAARTEGLRIFFIVLITVGVLLLLRVLFIKLGLSVEGDL